MQGVGAAEGQRGDGERGHRVQAARWRAVTRRSAHTAATPTTSADGQADADLADEEHGHVGEPVVVVLQPLDEAEHEQDGDRVVEARLALERASPGGA